MDETSQKSKVRVLSRAHALLSKDGEVHLVLEEDSFVGEATEELGRQPGYVTSTS